MDKIFKEYKTRILWLSIGLLLSLAIAKTVNSFQSLLEEHLLLAGFIPMVVYLSDAIGTQMESVTIRAIALDKRFKLKSFIFKQLLLTILISITLSVITYFAVTFIWTEQQIAIVISLGLFIASIVSVATGGLIPYLFWKLNQDPAEASGPIATVIQDFLSALALLIVAQILL